VKEERGSKLQNVEKIFLATTRVHVCRRRTYFLAGAIGTKREGGKHRKRGVRGRGSSIKEMRKINNLSGELTLVTLGRHICKFELS
jgi:hypothetical protein